MLLLKINSRNWLRQNVDKRLLTMSWAKVIDALVKGIKDDQDYEYNA
jgi:hypothetical protein